MCFLLCVATGDAQQKRNTTKKAATTSTSTARKSASRTTAKKKSATARKATAGKNKPEVTNSSIRGLRNEQSRIKQNIRRQEQALRANKAQVKQKLQTLQQISSDIQRRQQSIDSINKDIHHIDNNIGLLSSQLDNLQRQLEERKQSYVKSMRYMAKHSNIQNQLMFIFSAKNLTESLRRLRFVRQYAAYQRTQGKAVEEKQKLMAEKRTQLHATRGQKATMLSRGHKEQAALSQQKDEEQKLVNSLQKEQKTITAVIEEQKKKDAALNSQIDRLVAIEVEKARQRAIAEAKRKAEAAAAAKKKAEELARRKAEAEARARENARRIAEAKAEEERAKAAARIEARNAEAKARAEQKAREAEAARVAAERKAAADKERAEKAVAEAKHESEAAATISSEDRSLNSSFESNRGRLPFPVSGGRITGHYGLQTVEGTKGVTLANHGIKVRCSAGTPVHAVYNGKVTAVFNTGDGTWGVIVSHGTYMSVYCNLSSVSVRTGQSVSTRQTVGAVDHNGILEFQLRKGKVKQNPEAWLAR